MTAASHRLSPGTAAELAQALRDAAAGGAGARLVGGGTKLGWGAPASAGAVELSTARLDRLLEHNAGDLTAVLEAGVPLAQAQRAFAAANQMLALDPPLGPDERATIGGVVSTADSGPLRHGSGGPRDLVIGIAVALADGTIARAGGRVIKNVAGYDLAKLFAGSFGSLGAIVEVTVRLHPRPEAVTLVGEGDDAAALGRAALALAQAPLELACLDVRWEAGRGAVLARVAGSPGAVEARARAARPLLEREGLATSMPAEQLELWERQRAGQRAGVGGAALRVSGLPGELPRVLRVAAAAGASVVGRAGAGLSWLTLAPASDAALVAAIDALRRDLAPFPCVLLDAPAGVRAALDPWQLAPGPELELMRALKRRFDPAGACNPGVFPGGG